MLRHIKWTFLPANTSEAAWGRWDALNHATHRTPLLHSRFIALALHYFGNGTETMAFASVGGEDIAACILDNHLPSRPQTFAASQLPLCTWLHRSQYDFSKLAKSLISHLPTSPFLLSFISLDPRLTPMTFSGKYTRLLPHITTGAVDLPPTFEQYIQSRSKNVLKNVNRRIRKADNDFGVPSLKILHTPEEVAQAVDVYAQLESKSWKAEIGTALTPNDHQTQFYKAAMVAFCHQKIGRVYQLLFGDRVVAVQLAIVDGSQAYLLKSTYDVECHACSPGILLKWMLLKSLFQEPRRITRLEYYGPLIAAQQDWVTELRVMYHINTYRHRVWAGLHALSQKIRQPH